MRLQWQNDDSHYGVVAKCLHWVVAALVFLQLGLGIYGANLPLSFDKLVVLARHKSVGITIFGLAALRILWRCYHRPPPLPRQTPVMQRYMAHAVHALLYVLLFALPVTGWLFSSASGISVSWFDVFVLPDLVDADKVLAGHLLTTHIVLAISLAALLIGHIGAALWHHFVAHDSILIRMLPWGGYLRRKSG